MLEWLKKLSRKAPANRVVDDIRFLREQDGTNERALKAALSPVLAKWSVSRAYLVVIQETSSESVALCMTSPQDIDLVRAVGAVVVETLPKNVFLDIMFVRDAEQEARIARVCKPFHVA